MPAFVFIGRDRQSARRIESIPARDHGSDYAQALAVAKRAVAVSGRERSQSDEEPD